MITELSNTTLTQRCDLCGATASIVTANLVAGIEQVGAEPGDVAVPLDPNVIALPPCSACGGFEFLNRSSGGPDGPAGPDDRSVGAEHRRAVNALHRALVAAGRVAPSLKDYFAAEGVPDVPTTTLPWALDPKAVPAVPARDRAVAEAGFADWLARRSGGQTP